MEQRNKLILQTEKTLEDIKHIDENGVEFWYGRELMLALGYSSWDKFKNIIKKAKIACENSEMPVFQ